MRITGVIENMSYLVETGQEIFGSGGGQTLATEIDAPLIGKIPLDPALREAADAGMAISEVAPTPRSHSRSARSQTSFAHAVHTASARRSPFSRAACSSPEATSEPEIGILGEQIPISGMTAAVGAAAGGLLPGEGAAATQRLF